MSVLKYFAVIAILYCVVAANDGVEWSFIGGCQGINCNGKYGSVRTTSPENWPGARILASTWADKLDRLWLFGGAGFDNVSTLSAVLLNDLWMYNPLLSSWTWMTGSQTGFEKNKAGQVGEFKPEYTPGARSGAAAWFDNERNQLWLFGGYYVNGNPSRNTGGYTSDLWVFDVSSTSWAFYGGNVVQEIGGNYGTKGVPDPSNLPPQRAGATTWTANGKFYMFGGESASGNYSTRELLSDVWMLDPKTRLWTWIAGPNTPNAPARGRKGEVSPDNTPSARSHASGWVDQEGNFWLFGGDGIDETYKHGLLNDLWKFDTRQNVWIWIAGSMEANLPGKYGNLREIPSDESYVPGSRAGAIAWTQRNEEGSMQLWLSGGYGFDKHGGARAYLSDVWAYDTKLKRFIWMDGAYDGNARGNFRGDHLSPGSRQHAMVWKTSNSLTVFGGIGYTTQFGYLNDGWRVKEIPQPHHPSKVNPAAIFVPIILILLLLGSIGAGVLYYYRKREDASGSLYSAL